MSSDTYLRIDAHNGSTRDEQSLQIEARFWANVVVPRVDAQPGKDCWVWKGCRNAKGYGSFRLRAGQNPFPAHRASFSLFCGEIPEGVHVLHSCDNPPCVRPSHLFLGTNADNIRDREEKGRGVRLSGDANAATKISDSDAVKIKQAFSLGWKQRDLAQAYGVSQFAIWFIIHKRKVNANV